MKIALPSANNLLLRRNGKRIVFAKPANGFARGPARLSEHEPDDASREIVIHKNGKETPTPARMPLRNGATALVALGSRKRSDRGVQRLAAAPADRAEPVGATKPKGRGNKKSDWEPIATFVVEFELREDKGKTIERRTRAHHHEATVDKEWPGFVREELCQWMTVQLGEELAKIERRAVASQREIAPKARPGTADPDIDWQIAAVRLMRSGRDEPIATLYDRGQCAHAMLSRQSPFAIELSLERPARGGRDRAVARLDSVRFRAHNRDTRATIELGQAQVTPTGAAQTLSLNVGSLATAGSYRLECVPVVAGAELPDSVVAVPLLQVI